MDTQAIKSKTEETSIAEAEAAAAASAPSKTDARKAARVGAPAPKVTEAELMRRCEEERLRLEREAEVAKKRAARTVEEEEYERVVLVANTNRDDSIIEASSVNEAIVRMSLVDSEAALPADRHPERRLKASFKAFEDAELPKLKEEKPGLTLKQYKDVIWKLWKKSPDNPLNKMSLPSVIIKLTLGLLWSIIHLGISLFSLCFHLIYNLECYLISSGLLPKYRNLRVERLKYMAVVVDSREAKNTVKVKQLLCWLSTIGVKYVCLYDIDGVLKKLFEPGMNASGDDSSGDYYDCSANIKALHCCHRDMTMECISGSDGKEGIAKAANLLCSTYSSGDRYTHGNDKCELVFTEADMASALKSVGCGGPEPDLLLVYGPARCHLGFPVWRLRYTEIMHMGQLKSMKYGAIVKAFYNFSKKYQNYGK